MGQPNRIESEEYAREGLQKAADPVGRPGSRDVGRGLRRVGRGLGGKELMLGYIGWDENVAVSSLTKVLLEEELGYRVELQRTNVAVVKQVFQGVAEGNLDAFQDVWMPNQKKYLREVGKDVEHLDPWFEGKTTRRSSTGTRPPGSSPSCPLCPCTGGPHLRLLALLQKARLIYD
jgi:hypothetical protein